MDLRSDITIPITSLQAESLESAAVTLRKGAIVQRLSALEVEARGKTPFELSITIGAEASDKIPLTIQAVNPGSSDALALSGVQVFVELFDADMAVATVANFRLVSSAAVVGNNAVRMLIALSATGGAVVEVEDVTTSSTLEKRVRFSSVSQTNPLSPHMVSVTFT